MQLQDLGGSWQMRRTDENTWLPAQVPGSVYGDLLRCGRIEDPFFGRNEADALRLSDFDYEYRRTFSVFRETLLACGQIALCFGGLDTICDVFLNGVPILHSEDMHRAWELDVKRLLREGENELRAVFHSPTRRLAAQAGDDPVLNGGNTMRGFTRLRKAHYMFGWDWGPMLPDMGFWRPVTLCGWGCARIGGVKVTQIHGNGGAAVKLRAEMKTWEPGHPVRFRIVSPDGTVCEQSIEAADGAAEAEFLFPHPQLWWPNNLGPHPLYTVNVSASDSGGISDEKEFRIGLRTLTVRREKDEWGESFAFTVNGVPFFSMGADYIPEDSLTGRLSAERTEKLIRSCVRANFNTLRVWGGGFYPDDRFYDLCDEYGLVVWQDLMFACGVYYDGEALRENIAEETAQAVRRLRNHACLGLWSGNNEMEQAWESWDSWKSQSPRRRAEYIKLFEVLLADVVRKNDPVTFWWPSSPSSGGGFEEPNSENRGDMHYWEVWHGGKPFTAYRGILPRFLSEFGIQSFPCLKTVESFTLPEDRNIFSAVMESHQKCGGGNEKIFAYLSQYFRYPKDFGSLLYVSQLIQAEGLRCGVEHLRRNRGRCMGAVYWQLNDCWPAPSWASLDYFGRWKALHCAARRFFAPVMISACEEGVSAGLFLSNETREAVSGEAEWRLETADGGVLRSGRTAVQAPALSSVSLETLDFSAELDSPERRESAFLAFRFVSGGRELSRGAVMFVPAKHFRLSSPKLAAQTADAGESFRITLKAASFAPFTELSVAGADPVFSDNFFPLLPGEAREISVLKDELPQGMTAEQLSAALRLRSLYDSFEHAAG